MPTVIPVKFAYAARDLSFDPAGTSAQEGDHVICATERGHEIGLATSDAREVAPEELSATIGHAQLRDVVRIATDEDLERAEELARRGEESLPAFRRHVSESGLDMKPVGVEYLFDGEKAVCYFAAEERVDFRQLVRDLSREFHVRIDMRQIGVREEAAIVGGYGHCGQELCCRRFATGFDPVSIRMAKEQDLPLNSTKISGACGRLMCCLRYEFEAYRDFKSRAPKRNAVIDTPLGKAKIVEYDTPKEQLCLRLESGKQIRVPLADMTASEAAHKKSEELGCPCRPDTVTREVLDKLEAPDVQMALAELDRKNGVLAEPEVDAADIFVAPKRKRRRPSSGAPSAEKGVRAGAESAPSGDEAPAPRRRRKRRPGDGGAAAQPDGGAAAPGRDAPPSPPPGRRGRRGTLPGGQAHPPSWRQGRPGGRRRPAARHAALAQEARASGGRRAGRAAGGLGRGRPQAPAPAPRRSRQGRRRRRRDARRRVAATRPSRPSDRRDPDVWPQDRVALRLRALPRRLPRQVREPARAPLACGGLPAHRGARRGGHGARHGDGLRRLQARGPRGSATRSTTPSSWRRARSPRPPWRRSRGRGSRSPCCRSAPRPRTSRATSAGSSSRAACPARRSTSTRPPSTARPIWRGSARPAPPVAPLAQNPRRRR